LTPLTHPARRATLPSRQRARRSTHATTREARTRRSYDAVLSSYIRELAATQDQPRQAR
jgi:hypothetical protein